MRSRAKGRVRSLVLGAAAIGCVVVAAGGASADEAAALDAKAREATRQIISTVQKAAAESRTFAEATKSIESFAQSRRQAERGRASATAGLKVAQTATKEEAKYRRSGGKNRQALKNALSSYDRAIAAARQLTQIEATVAACDKGMEMMLPRVESSAKKIKAGIGDLDRAVASLERTVRSMRTKKVNPNLVAQWERQFGKAKSDRDQIAGLRPAITKRAKDMRKLAAIPSSAAAAKKKIAAGNARHSRALAKLESLEAKRAILAMQEDQGAAAIARAGMTFDDCDVRKVDWKNFEYFGGRGGPLRNGETHWETEYESHDISLTNVVYADLDGDSEHEAYVWITDWLDWAEVGTEGSEDLHIFTVDATCRLVRIGGAHYWTDVPPGKIVGQSYVVTDPFFKNVRVEWFFKDGELTSVEKPLENED